jgi:hypothetical protein
MPSFLLNPDWFSISEFTEPHSVKNVINEFGVIQVLILLIISEVVLSAAFTTPASEPEALELKVLKSE